MIIPYLIGMCYTHYKGFKYEIAEDKGNVLVEDGHEMSIFGISVKECMKRCDENSECHSILYNTSPHSESPHGCWLMDKRLTGTEETFNGVVGTSWYKYC